MTVNCCASRQLQHWAVSTHARLSFPPSNTQPGTEHRCFSPTSYYRDHGWDVVEFSRNSLPLAPVRGRWLLALVFFCLLLAPASHPPFCTAWLSIPPWRSQGKKPWVGARQPRLRIAWPVDAMRLMLFIPRTRQPKLVEAVPCSMTSFDAIARLLQFASWNAAAWAVGIRHPHTRTGPLAWTIGMALPIP